MIDERVARIVAAQVLVVAAVAVATGAWWLAAPLAAGFALRVAGGPRWSPAGVIARRLAPRFGAPRPTPAPPKRFAQAIGLVFASAAAALGALGYGTASAALLLALVVAAGLEAAFGFCVGCRAFALLMRVGLVPRSVCERCVVAHDPQVP